MPFSNRLTLCRQGMGLERGLARVRAKGLVKVLVTRIKATRNKWILW